MMAAAQLGMLRTAEASQRVPRELAALARATTWLNSPRLTPAVWSAKSCSSSSAPSPASTGFGPSVCAGMGDRVQGRSRAHRRAHPGVRVREDLDNVRRAVKKMKIGYPIVIDNDYSIWRAFKNQYWPALYLVDAEGASAQRRFGEGDYEQSEMAIRDCWRKRVSPVASGLVSVDAGGVEAAGRLEQREVSGELPRSRAHGELRVAGRSSWTGLACMGPPRDVAESVGPCRQLDGRHQAIVLTGQRGGSSAAFTRAIFIW